MNEIIYITETIKMINMTEMIKKMIKMIKSEYEVIVQEHLLNFRIAVVVQHHRQRCFEKIFYFSIVQYKLISRCRKIKRNYYDETFLQRIQSCNRDRLKFTI